MAMSDGSSDRQAAATSLDMTVRRDKLSGARSSAPVTTAPSRSSLLENELPAERRR
jgi:hypothetical protein